MRKLKKILSAILIMAMVFSLNAFSALADESSSGGSASSDSLDQLKFYKVFQAEEGNILPSAQFKFKMEPVDLGSQSGKVDDSFIQNVPIYSGISLGDNSIATVNFEATISSGSGNATEKEYGVFDLSALKDDFKEAMKDSYYQYGLFSYKISEITSDDDCIRTDITYDTKEYNVDVWVDRDGNIQLYLNKGVTESWSSGGNDNKSEITFTNTYNKGAKTTELLIKKTVKGDMISDTQKFDFSLVINSNSSKATSFTGTLIDQNGEKSTGKYESGKEYEFKLASGEYFTITGIPEGSTYVVEETSVSDDFTTKINFDCEANASNTETTKNVDGATFDATNMNTPIVAGENIVEFVNESTYKTPDKKYTELSFKKTYENLDGDVLPEATFDFSMTPAEVSTSDNNGTFGDLTVKKGIALDNPTVSLTYQSLSENTQTGTFILPTSDKLAGPAVYKYIVQEVIPENKSDVITYDETKYYVYLEVDKGGHVTDIVKTKEDGSAIEDNGEISFRNTCEGDDLVIEKEVEGNFADKNESFEFSINIPVVGTKIGLTQGQSIKGVITRIGGKTEEFEVIVGSDYYRFSLKGGESLAFYNVPVGMIYTVKEDDYSKEGYETSITYTTIKKEEGKETDIVQTFDGNVFEAATKGAIIDGGNKVLFTNKKDAKAETGLNIDVIPYIGVFVLALIGLAFLMTRKRENRF